jgi:hypothetical protein
MPRTALRYAIELMPKELKTEAMKRTGNSGSFRQNMIYGNFFELEWFDTIFCDLRSRKKTRSEKTWDYYLALTIQTQRKAICLG